MIDSGFTKFDTTKGRNLDEVIQKAVEAISGDIGEDTLNAVLDAVKEMTAVPTELADYYVGRITTGEMTYYPRKDTMRVLHATRQILFMDDLYSPDAGEPGKPVYVTVRFDSIDAFTWYPNVDEEAAPALVFPRAA